MSCDEGWSNQIGWIGTSVARPKVDNSGSLVRKCVVAPTPMFLRVDFPLCLVCKVLTMEDLVLPGKLEQFKPQWRCEACQNRNTPCVIQAECDRCIACAGAACDCYFVRTIVKRASKTTFSWNELTHKPDIPDPPIDEDFLKTEYVTCSWHFNLFK